MSDQEEKAPEQTETSRKRRRRSNSPKRNCKFSKENLSIIMQGLKPMRFLQRDSSGSSDQKHPRIDVVVAVGLFIATVVFIRALPAY